jgi:hypothetical protein
MKLLSILILASATAQSICSADITKLLPADRAILQEASRFKGIYTTKDIPSEITSLFADGNGRIAQPGQKWEATDVIMDMRLPRKRLIWAAVNGNLFVVHYEGGGIGHSYHVLIAKYNHGDRKAEVVWHGVGEPLKDYADFLRALKRNKLDDRYSYYL